MEIIDLSSDSEEANSLFNSPALPPASAHPENDIIEILDDHEPEKDALQELLDLQKWICSEEESLELSLSKTSPRADRFSSETAQPVSAAKKTLPSSPVPDRVFESDFISELAQSNEPESHSPPYTQYDAREKSPSRSPQLARATLPEIPPATKKRLYEVPKVISDPIESSSPVKSPPPKRKKATKAAKSGKPADERSSKEWRDANKVTRRKQDVMSEMVLEIPVSLESRLVTAYFKTVFEFPRVRTTYLELPLITWKRRVTAKYSKEEDLFIPCDLMEISERVLLLFYEAEDLVNKLQNGVIANDMARAKAKATAEDPNLTYYLYIMVPCFGDYVRKLQTQENRQYRERTLQSLNQRESLSRTKKNLPMTAAEAVKLLVTSEVSLGVNIFATKSMDESIDWLHSFTYTIGNALYDKLERNPEFANIGAIKSGSTPKGAYIEMIKKFNMMTDPKAENLYQYYASPLSLYRRFQQSRELGSVQGRAIVPPSVNKLLRKVFTSNDPDAVITD